MCRLNRRAMSSVRGPLFVSLAVLLLCVCVASSQRCGCPCRSTGPRCITSCTGRKDGDYQSCSCCHGDRAFIKCVAGLMYYMACPANLVWADDADMCNYTSNTCTECSYSNEVQQLDLEPKVPIPEVSEPHPEVPDVSEPVASEPAVAPTQERCRCPCTSTGRQCVSSCAGRKDGDYQSCQCCHGDRAFITCSNGLTYYRPCPAGLVWADNVKQCNYTSSTCTECVFSHRNPLKYQDWTKL